MKRKKVFLLPLILLFTMLMACSAFAKPKLSTKSITLYKFEEPKWLDNGKTSMTKKNAQYWADYGRIIVTGVSMDAEVSCSSKKFDVAGSYPDFGYYKNKYTISVELKWKYDPFRQVKVKAGKYSLKLKITDNGQTYSYTIKVYVRNYQPQCIKYLKVGSKTYRAAFRKRNAGYITMSLPKGKKKITYSCPKGFVKQPGVSDYPGFSIIRKGKYIGYYKNRSKVTLKKGDILCIEYTWKTWAKSGVLYIKVK